MTPSVEPVPTPTAEPTPTPTPTPEPTPTPDPFEGELAVLEPGTPFLILQESGPWWLVSTGWGTGWVEHRYCMIKLPNVIPSMIFDATNSYQSMYICCGKEIPGVTGASFYPGKQPNRRLDRDQFVMPILYASAKKVNQAQQAALAQGNTLLLREAYRPNNTQLAVVKGMNALIRQDPEVKQAITARPWSLT